MTRMSFTEALDEALELLEQGQPLEYCVRRFPEHADELRPLLQVSDDLRRLADAPLPLHNLQDAEPDWQMLLKSTPQIPDHNVPGFRIPWLQEFQASFQMPQMQRFSALAVALLVLFFASIGFSNRSAPGAPLYPIKKIVEQAQLSLALSSEQKLAQSIQLAKRRVVEFQQLASAPDADPELLEQAIADMGAAFENANAAVITSSDDVDRGLLTELRNLASVADMSIAQAATTAPAEQASALRNAAGAVSALQQDLNVIAGGTPSPTGTAVSSEPAAGDAEPAAIPPTPTIETQPTSVPENPTDAPVVAPEPTQVPPTNVPATPVPPTNVPATPVPPTATPEPPTATPEPPTEVPTPEPTPTLSRSHRCRR